MNYIPSIEFKSQWDNRNPNEDHDPHAYASSLQDTDQPQDQQLIAKYPRSEFNQDDELLDSKNQKMANIQLSSASQITQPYTRGEVAGTFSEYMQSMQVPSSTLFSSKQELKKTDYLPSIELNGNLHQKKYLNELPIVESSPQVFTTSIENPDEPICLNFTPESHPVTPILHLPLNDSHMNPGQEALNPGAAQADAVVDIPMITATQVADPEMDEARKTLIQTLEFYAFVTIIYVLGICVLNGYTDGISFLYYLAIVCLIKIVRCFKKAFNPELSNEQFKKLFFVALDWISFSNLISGALGLAQLFNIPLSAFVGPGFASTILYLCFADSDSMGLTKGNIAVIKLLFWTQVSLITLKIDEQISTWAFVFLMLFYIIVFFMSVSIGFFILAVSYVCQFVRTASIDATGVGLIWNFINSLFSWIWGFTVLGIIDGLDGDSTTVLQPCLLVGLGHAAILVLMTIFCRKSLMEYLVLAMRRRDEEQIRAENRHIFERVKDNMLYLVQVSPTYFIMMDETSKMGRDKAQNQHWKHQILDAKKKSHAKHARYILDTDVEEQAHMPQIQLVGHKGFQAKSNKVNRSFNVKDLENYNKKKKTSNFSPLKGNEAGLLSKICYSRDDIDILEDVQRPALDYGHDSQGEGEDRQCIVCFSCFPDAVFMGCGHGGVCYECALETWKRGDACLLCRQPIKEILKIALVPGVDVVKVLEGTKKSLLLD